MGARRCAGIQWDFATLHPIIFQRKNHKLFEKNVSSNIDKIIVRKMLFPRYIFCVRKIFVNLSYTLLNNIKMKYIYLLKSQNNNTL